VSAGAVTVGSGGSLFNETSEPGVL
jgi:hypothetical protein